MRKKNRQGLASLIPLLAVMLMPTAAAADAELNLFDLVMAQESVTICGFSMSEDKVERVEAEIGAYLEELGRSEAELAELHEQAAWQVLRQKASMCAADGSWRQRFDELLQSLNG
jgi:hypothetical protein